MWVLTFYPLFPALLPVLLPQSCMLVPLRLCSAACVLYSSNVYLAHDLSQSTLKQTVILRHIRSIRSNKKLTLHIRHSSAGRGRVSQSQVADAPIFHVFFYGIPEYTKLIIIRVYENVVVIRTGQGHAESGPSLVYEPLSSYLEFLL